MIRLYVPEGAAINAEQNHYLRRVMRRDNTSQIYCFNETGEWLCQLDGTRIHQVRKPPNTQEKTIGIACIKKPRLEWLVEKLAELGITKLQLLYTDHSQPHLYDMNRLRKISIEATEQSNHLKPMTILEPTPLIDFLQAQPKSTFCQLGPQNLSNHSNTLLIGPEGGWSQREMELAQTAISFGPMTLRSETAAMIAGFILSQTHVTDPP
jgi:16S rRNA (uracil1498-N3)-methyltransferase